MSSKVITFKQKGDFSKTNKFFERAKELFHFGLFDRYGKIGVEALRSATPKKTGLTANSWYYEISHDQNGLSIEWKNSNIIRYVSIALVLQYGHGTRNGGYVKGRDYINPAIQPVFDQIAKEAWDEVTK